MRLFVLLFFAFSIESWANTPPFMPHYGQPPIPLTAGQPLVPLCSHPTDPLCIGQWSMQAVPLAVHPQTAPSFPLFQYFMPSFIPDGLALDDPEEDEGWSLWTPPKLSSDRKKRTSRKQRERTFGSKKRTFYRLKSNPNEVRIVEIRRDGTQLVLAVEEGLNVEEDIKKAKRISESPDFKEDEDWESFTPEFQESPEQTFYVNDKDPSQMRRVTTDAKGERVVQSGQVNLVSVDDILATEDGSYETSRDSHALPVTAYEVQPGCFVMDKQRETEAGFCFDCERNKSAPVLSVLVEDKGFMSGIKKLLRRVGIGSSRKVKSQTAALENSVEQICQPEASLKQLIKNFEKTCPAPYKNNFKEFFKKTHCESCKKGIPMEIMMAMMSVESSGRCYAVNKNDREESVGLFQVNSDVHQCQDSSGKTYRKRTSANVQCLKDPLNNLSKSIDILFDHYAQVNGQNPSSSRQCKSWLDMTTQEHDKWRKGVSAYNGGPQWVNRAIHAAQNQAVLHNTSFMAHRSFSASREDFSWEDLRVYYFVERLSPGNKGSGRQNRFTISNLAHTEAVLGRSVKGSDAALVEIWAQYKNKFLKKNPVSCP